MSIYKQFNQITRKYEDVKLSEVEVGSTVIQMFWTKNVKKFVTVHGQSLQVVISKGVAVPVLED